MKSDICLGCGTEYIAGADCEVCYQRLVRCLNVFAHWPMETSLTPAALHHIENAIRDYIDGDRAFVPDGPLRAELTLCASNIRSYLQHVAAGLRVYNAEPETESSYKDDKTVDLFDHEPTDEELLS